MARRYTRRPTKPLRGQRHDPEPSSNVDAEPGPTPVTDLAAWGRKEAEIRDLATRLLSPESARLEAEKRRIRAGLSREQVAQVVASPR